MLRGSHYGEATSRGEIEADTLNVFAQSQPGIVDVITVGLVVAEPGAFDGGGRCDELPECFDVGLDRTGDLVERLFDRVVERLPLCLGNGFVFASTYKIEVILVAGSVALSPSRGRVRCLGVHSKNQIGRASCRERV